MAETKVINGVERLGNRRRLALIMAGLLSIGGVAVADFTNLQTLTQTTPHSSVHSVGYKVDSKASSMQNVLRHTFIPTRNYGAPMKLVWDTREQVGLSNHAIKTLGYYSTLYTLNQVHFDGVAIASYSKTHIDNKLPKQDRLIFKSNSQDTVLTVTRQKNFGPIEIIQNTPPKYEFGVDSWITEFFAGLSLFFAYVLNKNMKSLTLNKELLEASYREINKTNSSRAYIRRAKRLGRSIVGI
jgi:hypothetical protein